jgi:hypothetical protein
LLVIQWIKSKLNEWANNIYTDCPALFTKLIEPSNKNDNVEISTAIKNTGTTTKLLIDSTITFKVICGYDLILSFESSGIKYWSLK